MNTKEIQIKQVYSLLGGWASEIKLNNYFGLNDINKFAEGFIASLMNLVFDYNLSNLNGDKLNYPGIDLGDTINKIAVQVTSRKDADKIRENLNTFVAKGQKDTFTDGIRFLILTVDDPKISFGSNPPTNIFSNFKEDEHIITLKNLSAKIDTIYDKDYEKFLKILNLLERELGSNRKKVEQEADDLPQFSFSFTHRDFVLDNDEDLSVLLQDVTRNYNQFHKITIAVIIEEEEKIRDALKTLENTKSDAKTKKKISDIKDILLHFEKIKREIKFKVSSTVFLKIKEGFPHTSFDEFANALHGLLKNLEEVDSVRRDTILSDIINIKYKAGKEKWKEGDVGLHLSNRENENGFRIYESEERVNEIFRKYIPTFTLSDRNAVMFSSIYGVEVSDLGYESFVSKVIPSFIVIAYENNWEMKEFGLNHFNVAIA